MAIAIKRTKIWEMKRALTIQRHITNRTGHGGGMLALSAWPAHSL